MLNSSSRAAAIAATKLLALQGRFSPADVPVIENRQFSLGALDPTSIKVLNWNIAKNNEHPQWLADFNQFMIEGQLDLMFFQEVRLCWSGRCPLAVQGVGWNFAPNFMDVQDRSYFGVLTASNVKSLWSQSLLSQYAEPIVNTPKVALITEYPLRHSNQKLLTVNIHGINFVSTSKFKAQLHQLEKCLTMHQGPLILSGDFNTWNRDRMALLTRMTTRLGLKSVQFDEKQHPKRFWLTHPLDHIFYRGLEEKPGSAMIFSDCASSDHYPMRVEFSMTSDAKPLIHR